jgi:hypothetical protein
MCSKLEKETSLISQMFRKQLHTVISAHNKIRKVLKSKVSDDNKLKTIAKIIIENSEKFEIVTIESINQ